MPRPARRSPFIYRRQREIEEDQYMVALRTVLSAFFGAAFGAALVLVVIRATPVGDARASSQLEASHVHQAVDVPTVSSAVGAVYRQDNAGVVSIETSQASPATNLFGRQGQSEGAGSGFVVDTQGNVVTNDHVVNDATSVRVVFNDGTSVSGKVVGQDPGDDLAVVKVDVAANRLHPLTIGDSST